MWFHQASVGGLLSCRKPEQPNETWSRWTRSQPRPAHQGLEQVDPSTVASCSSGVSDILSTPADRR